MWPKCRRNCNFWFMITSHSYISRFSFFLSCTCIFFLLFPLHSLHGWISVSFLTLQIYYDFIYRIWANECECSTPVDKQFESMTQLSRNIIRTIGKNEKVQSIFVTTHTKYREKIKNLFSYNKINIYSTNRCMFYQTFRNKHMCRLIFNK